VSTKVAVDWCNFLRDLCSYELLQEPTQLGGPGHTVAINESIVAKRKPGSADGGPVPPMWVFGAVDLQTKEFFMEVVQQRDAATLLPIIRQNILPGSRIWSVERAAYCGLPGLGYVHETVNHSRRFVDPVTGAHTNNVEARWNACKATMKRRYGVPREQVPAYLDEYMWRCRRSPSDVFLDILEAMRRRYPC